MIYITLKTFRVLVKLKSLAIGFLPLVLFLCVLVIKTKLTWFINMNHKVRNRIIYMDTYCKIQMDTRVNPSLEQALTVPIMEITLAYNYQ